MKSTGIVRKLDGLGRFVLPKELRETMNLGIKDPVEIHLEKDKIIITKYDENAGQSGIVRNIDKLGRVVIPKEIRRRLKLNVYDPLEVYIDKQRVILKNFISDKACIITGIVDDSNITFYYEKLVLSKDGARILYNKLKDYLAE